MQNALTRKDRPQGVRNHNRIPVCPLHGWRRLSAGLPVHGGHGGADGVFDREDDIVLLFAILAEAGEISGAFRHDLRPVARAAGHELAGDQRHH